MLSVCRKRKDDFFTGATTALSIEDPKYKVWKSKNNIVILWLINYMTKEITEDFNTTKPGMLSWKTS